MISNIPSTTPAQNPDGTISAIIQEVQPVADVGALLHLWLPIAHREGGGVGKFFLVRCADDTPNARANNWSIYTRRALFCATMPVAMPDQAGSSWTLWIPSTTITRDPCYQWLLQRPRHTSLNLLGSFGLTFELAPHTQTLAVITEPPMLALALPVVHQMLDQGGRVTLLIKGEAEAAAPLLPLIPIPVEVRMIPERDWLAHLAQPVRWADQLCAVLPNQEYAPLAQQIRTLRFQLDTSFAHALVTSDLLCGVGACLACVVPLREGSHSRACIHGPLFPLAAIAQ